MTELIVGKTQVGKVASVNELIQALESASAPEEKVAAVRETKASRQKEWKKALDLIPMEKIEELNQVMSSYVEEFLLGQVEVGEGPRELTTEEVSTLAEEYKSWEGISDFLQARKDQFREIVFGHLDLKIEEEQEKLGVLSETPPSQTPGEVSANGIRFKREGGTRKAPTINWDTLKKELGEEFSQVVDVEEIPEQVIPAHTVETPSEEKFLEAVRNGDIPLEVARKVLEPGKWNTPRFVVRKG